MDGRGVLPLITGQIAPTRAFTLLGTRTLQNVIVVYTAAHSATLLPARAGV